MYEKNIILASKSPRRHEILKNAGYTFTVIEADIDEAVKDLPPEKAVAEIALQKALYVKNHHNTEGSVIIAADTMVYAGGSMLGKPKDAWDAFRMLKLLSGTWHKVYTGYAVIDGEKTVTGCEETAVKFRELSDKEINEYISTGEPFDKAGSYGVQDRASVFVERIEGDFFNVMGLPICRIAGILNQT
jgi:septum formation protein